MYVHTTLLSHAVCRLAVDQRLAQDRDQVAEAALAAVREWRAARQ